MPIANSTRNGSAITMIQIVFLTASWIIGSPWSGRPSIVSLPIMNL